ncbi:hypothetical protein CRENBAI_002416 [Crenichthys baileyi]|uniref:Uncharacterized protein n=1 Tax=Crenichthys baileyi TaxID=28760 RepID=A0AAV9RGR3_9TELE
MIIRIQSGTTTHPQQSLREMWAVNIGTTSLKRHQEAGNTGISAEIKSRHQYGINSPSEQSPAGCTHPGPRSATNDTNTPHYRHCNNNPERNTNQLSSTVTTQLIQIHIQKGKACARASQVPAPGPTNQPRPSTTPQRRHPTATAARQQAGG